MKKKALIGAYEDAWDDIDSVDEGPSEHVAYMAMEDPLDAHKDASETEQEVTHESLINSLDNCSKPKLI